MIERDLKKQIASVPGSGAAGGNRAALLAFLDAELQPGIRIVMETTGLEEAIIGADLVVTGEGRIDGQSIHGQTPVGVGRLAARYGVPVIALAGSIGPGAEKVHDQGISALFCIGNGPCLLGEALSSAADNLRTASKNVFAVMQKFYK